MPTASGKYPALAPVLLLGAVASWLLDFLAPDLAWMAAAAILILSSVTIMHLGIRVFLVVTGLTIVHFITMPPPYGRSELPLDFLLQLVILPFLCATASVGIWYWRERA